MRVHDVLLEAAERTIGRDLVHPEDLIFISGSEGALEAIDVFERIGSDISDVTVKWDGSPAVIFGRDEFGDFILTDKYGFNSKKYDGRVKSPLALERMILGRSVNKMDANRQIYARQMANVWQAFESAVPPTFRGFMHGDLMYKTKPAMDGNDFVFQPNQVLYRVPYNTELGGRIARSNGGVAIHTQTDLGGNVTFANPERLVEGALCIMPPIGVGTPPIIDVNEIRRLRNIVRKNSQIIDSIVAPRTGLRDIKKFIYSYVNETSANKNWGNLVNGFETWVLGSSRVPETKKTMILDLPEIKNIPILFDIMIQIQNLKNNIITQMDNSVEMIDESINGERGGEGYVVARDKIKLVPRHKFIISSR